MTAITWLFVPGSRPERFARAAASGADEIVIDLEDAVAATAKEAARDAAVEWLRDSPAWVRINGNTTPWHDADLAALSAVRPRGVIVPKAQSPDDLARLHLRLRCDLIALVESAAGVDAAGEIAGTDGVTRLAFGSIDFALDLGASETREALLFARSRLVVASRVAGLPAPIDGVTVQLTDPAAAADDARYARGLGFGGKLCIHPAQIGPVAAAFAPTPAELAWAQEIVASATPGASQVAGTLVDEPVLVRARRLLDARPAVPEVEQGS